LSANHLDNNKTHQSAPTTSCISFSLTSKLYKNILIFIEFAKYGITGASGSLGELPFLIAKLSPFGEQYVWLMKKKLDLSAEIYLPHTYLTLFIKLSVLSDSRVRFDTISSQFGGA